MFIIGINLQTADVVILYDSDWNPQADLQAQVSIATVDNDERFFELIANILHKGSSASNRTEKSSSSVSFGY